MNETTRWWWIRHGPVDAGGRIYGQQDLPADTSNRATFQALAAQLPRDAHWLTSQLQRTHQTAQALHAERAELAPAGGLAVEPGFVEQHFGDWQGQTYDDLGRAQGQAQGQDTWHRFWLAPAHEVPPGGESFTQVITRVGAAIDALNAQRGGQDLVVVAHGGTIRAAVAQALGLEPERALALTVETCSLTRLDHIAGSAGSHDPDSAAAGVWRVVALNRTFP